MSEQINFKNRLLDEFVRLEHHINGKKNSHVHKIRNKAIDYFAGIGFPTIKDEEWKYTRLNFLNEHSFNTALDKTEVDWFKNTDISPFLIPGLEKNVLVFINGFFVRELSSFLSINDKVSVMSFAEALDNDSGILNEHFGKHVDFKNDAFTAVNTALANDGFVIHVPDGQVIEHPIHMIFLSDATKNDIFVQPRNLVVAGKNAQVKVVETCYTFGKYFGFTNLVTEIVAEENSNIEFYRIHNCKGNSYYIGNTQVTQKKNSVFYNNSISLKGKFIRNNLNTKLDDEHCESNMLGMFFMDNQDFVDNHTLVDHAKPNSLSNESYRGVLDDKATGVFSGKILVRPNAQKTQAYQSNKNILLTDTATINTKPQLEIYADDVKCSHGATSGFLDQDSMFYLLSRGIPEQKAKSLLLYAFTSEIIDEIKIPELKVNLKKQIANRLNISDIDF